MEHILEDFNHDDGVYVCKIGIDPFGSDIYHFLFFCVDYGNFVPEDYVPPVVLYFGTISDINSKSLSKLKKNIRQSSSISSLYLDQFRKIYWRYEPKAIFECSINKLKVKLTFISEEETKEHIYEYCAFPNS